MMPHPQGAEGDPDNRALYLSAAQSAAQQARTRAGLACVLSCCACGALLCTRAWTPLKALS